MEPAIDHVPCGVLVFNDAGTIVSANATLEKWLKYPAGTLTGKTMDSLLPLSGRVFYSTHFFPLVKLQSHAEEIFMLLATSDNESVPVLCNATREVEGGKARNICSIMRVLQRRKYEEELLQARRTSEQALKENAALHSLSERLESRTQELDQQLQRMSSMNRDLLQFGKIVSHDLQEPIRKIRLFANMLETKLASKEESGVSALQKINAAADRLALLTTGLQQYVNIDAPKRRDIVDLNAVLMAAKAKVLHDRDMADIRIQSEPLPSIEGFPVLLELLFYHLLDNSIQFRRPEVPLEVSVRSTLVEENLYRAIPDKYRFVEHARIAFSDNGAGFDDQYKDYVFDLVNKVDLQSKGLGIGLAVIRKIVHNHYGTIEVKSAAGAGTTVLLVLPLKIPQA